MKTWTPVVELLIVRRMSPSAGVKVLSEVAKRLMMDVRGGRLNVCNEVRQNRLQPIDQGHPTAVPAGDIAGDVVRRRLH